MFSSATPRVLVASQIGRIEVLLRIEMQLFGYITSCDRNIHVLNCECILVLFNTFFRQKNPQLCGELGFQLLMTEQSDVYQITAKSCE